MFAWRQAVLEPLYDYSGWGKSLGLTGHRDGGVQNVSYWYILL